ncbi:polysaccharide biosynthesis tyrosine autokinase [Laspinema sp. A4]|uniref:GumC family protein n=1 Tax=Laspinema sp. D2d TaxID=2953686 RepID=UPI0021BADB7C|nr:polysaccharide biosynthesis tyrosine autokinase [Laspinema sp. D2d]MCT7986624.1 polysaccharide biosynthesis tyrosine autokinase [Laspinema sp. D2d]
MNPKSNEPPFFHSYQVPPSQEVINQSNKLAEKNEEELFNLSWLLGVLRRRSLVMIGVALSLTALMGGLTIRKSKQFIPSYEGSFRLLIEPVSAEGVLARQFIQSQSEGADINKIRIENGLVDYETLIRVLKSPKILSAILEDVQVQYPETNPSDLSKNLKIRRLTYEISSREFGTKILEVSYISDNPKEIDYVLNIASKYYLDYSLQERMIGIKQGVVFIEEQLPLIQNKVNTLQEEIQEFQQRYQLINPDVQGRLLSEHAAKIAEEKRLLQIQIDNSREKYISLQNLFSSGNYQAILANVPGYQQLFIELQALESEIAKESSRLLDNSLPMQSMRDKQENFRMLLSQESEKVLRQIAAEVEVLNQSKQALGRAEATLNQTLEEFPFLVRQYTDLQRQLDVSTETFKEFLSKLEALKLDAAQQEVPWQLIDPPSLPRDQNGNPIPANPPQTRKDLAIVAVLSMLLGIGSGFLVEVLIVVFHTPDEVKFATKRPILAVIPLAKELNRKARKTKKLSPIPTGSGGSQISSHLLVRGAHTEGQYSSSPVLESFRSLYTNIRLLSYERSVHSLVIGAAEPGDGKSTVAVELAKTASAIGQRVLLVDGDLRSPKIHTKMDLPNLRGLSDAISTDISLNDAIQRAPLDDNLFVLTSGPIPYDPIKLLSSKKMQSLMEQFQDFFDLVIYDTPPLVGLADGNLLAAQTDGLVLVVRLGKTDRYQVSKALDALQISGAIVIGLVVNGAKR